MTLDALRNRVKKNSRRLEPWSKRHAVTCFRLYDRDLPDIPLAIDRYETTDDETHLHVSVFEPRHGIERARVDAWAAAAAAELAIPAGRVHVKRRAPGETYEKQAGEAELLEVAEAGLRFAVNLDDYVDTGLFLDHRITRARVRAEAAGRRVLNLFAYTGAFTVYAAAGGAAASVSVDLSPTYARWTEENLARNALGAEKHRVVVDDVMGWLAQQRPPANGSGQFDLAVVDPPTLSRSKRAPPFEVQRDHGRLIARVLELLAPGGIAYFSTNFQGFELGTVTASLVDEVTHETVPPDFSRRPPIHRAWRIRK